jgi:hypothetical protein
MGGHRLSTIRLKLSARWPAVRAALIALTLAVGLLEGCPIPDRKHAPPWAHPLRDRAEDVRGTLLEPFAWVGKDLHFTQRWLLFRGASPKRFRLCVEAKTATGDWQLLHRAGDPEHAAYEDLLAYRRLRGQYSPGAQGGRGQYHPFAAWMTLRVLDDYPEFAVARTRMERVLIGDDGYAPTGEFSLEHQEPRRRK